MAQPPTFTFGDVIVQVATSSAASTFITICGRKKKSLKLSKETNTTEVPDCVDPDLPSWQIADVMSLSSEFEISGTTAKESLKPVVDLWNTTEPRKVRCRYVGGGSGGGTPDLLFEGDYHLVDLQLDAEWKERPGFECAFKSTGAVTMTAVAALP